MVYALATALLQPQIATRFAFEPLGEVIKSVLGPETKIPQTIKGVPIYARVRTWDEKSVQAFRTYLAESLNVEFQKSGDIWTITRPDRYYPNERLSARVKASIDRARSDIKAPEVPGIGKITTLLDVFAEIAPLLDVFAEIAPHLGTSLEDHSRIVFSTNPTAWQRPLPPAAAEKLRAVIALAPQYRDAVFTVSAYLRQNTLYFDPMFVDRTGEVIPGGRTASIYLPQASPRITPAGEPFSLASTHRVYVSALLDRKPLQGAFITSNGGQLTVTPSPSKAFSGEVESKSGSEMLAQSYREQALTVEQREALIAADPWTPLMEAYLDSEYEYAPIASEKRVFAMLPDNAYPDVLNLMRGTPRRLSFRQGLSVLDSLKVVPNENGIEVRPVTSSALLINLSNRTAMQKFLKADQGSLQSVLNYAAEENPVGAGHLLPMRYGYLASCVDSFLYDLCSYDYLLELGAFAAIPTEILNRAMSGKPFPVSSLPPQSINALKRLFLNRSNGVSKTKKSMRVYQGKTFYPEVPIPAERTNPLVPGFFEQGTIEVSFVRKPILKIEDSLRTRTGLGQLDRLATMFKDCMMSPQKVWEGEGIYYVMKLQFPYNWSTGSTVVGYDMTNARAISEAEFSKMVTTGGPIVPIFKTGNFKQTP